MYKSAYFTQISEGVYDVLQDIEEIKEEKYDKDSDKP